MYMCVEVGEAINTCDFHDKTIFNTECCFLEHINLEGGTSGRAKSALHDRVLYISMNCVIAWRSTVVTVCFGVAREAKNGERN